MLFIFPRKEIGGCKDVIKPLPILSAVKEHHPTFRRRMPEHFRVAFRMNQHRVVPIVLPGPSAIKAVGDAMGSVVVARPKSHEWWMVRIRSEARAVRIIDHARTGLHAAVQFLLPERWLQLSPMHQVFTDGVNTKFVPTLRE